MKQFIKKACMLVMVAFLCVGTVSGSLAMPRVSAATAKKTGWEKKNGKKYYYVNGKRVTGWYTIGNESKKSYKSYYFNSKGVLQPKKTKSINAKLVTEMDKSIKAAGVKANTNKKKALKLLFAYVVDKYGYMSAPRGFKCPKGWEYDFAKEMLTSKIGSCYHYAATYAFLAKRATGYPVRICWGKSNVFNKNNWQYHAWVEIKINKKWYAFDANAADYSKRKENGKKIDWYMQSPKKAAKYYKKTGDIKGTVTVEL